MTKVVARTKMPDYQLKGIKIEGKRNVYIGTSVYPTTLYRGMEIPSGETEAGYGVGQTGSGWIAGIYKHVRGEVIVIQQPVFPRQWTAKKRFDYFTGHYEPYAKEAEAWRKKHGVAETLAEVPTGVEDVIALTQGRHEVVYGGEVSELVKPVLPSEGSLVVREGTLTDPRYVVKADKEVPADDQVRMGTIVNSLLDKVYTGGEIVGTEEGRAGYNLGANSVLSKMGNLPLIAIAALVAIGVLVIGMGRR